MKNQQHKNYIFYPLFLLILSLVSRLTAQTYIEHTGGCYYKNFHRKKHNITRKILTLPINNSFFFMKNQNLFNKQNKYQLSPKKMQIKQKVEFKIMPHRELLIHHFNKKKSLILGESKIVISPYRYPKIIYGISVLFPNYIKPVDDLFKLKIEPKNPSPGQTCKLTLFTKYKPSFINIKLKNKKNKFFYFDKKEKNKYIYIARFGIDCMDKKREQILSIYISTYNGIKYTYKNSILYSASKKKRRDFYNIYKRAYLPSYKVRNIFKNRLISNDFFKTHKKLLPDKDRIAKKTKKQKPVFPPLYYVPSVKIPSAKMALYNRKNEIKKEYLIHYRALSYSSKKQLWEGNFLYPAYERFSSIFGEIRSYNGGWISAHRGIDIASFFHTAVKAPNSGIINFAGHTILCGKNIIIDHGQYIFSKIYHMNRIHVRKGQYVRKGQIIGTVGTSGISTGPHIHWEMLVGNTRVDPNQWTKLNNLNEKSKFSISKYNRMFADYIR